MTHPSARYYFGCLSARAAESSTRLDRTAGAAGKDSREGGCEKGFSHQQSEITARMIGAEVWRPFADPPSRAMGNTGVAAGTPSSVLARMGTSAVPSLLTVETTGFREPADEWDKLLDVLNRSFVVTEKREYLEDPAALIKDSLDPAVVHPRWRIVVRRWEQIGRFAGGE